MKGTEEMQRNISIIVVVVMTALILFLPKAAQETTRVKATHEGQFVPATGSIK